MRNRRRLRAFLTSTSRLVATAAVLALGATLGLSGELCAGVLSDVTFTGEIQWVEQITIGYPIGDPACILHMRGQSNADVPVFVYPPVPAATGICDDALPKDQVTVWANYVNFWCVGDTCYSAEEFRTVALEAMWAEDVTLQLLQAQGAQREGKKP